MARSGRPVVVVTRADAPDAAFQSELETRGVDVQWLRTIALLRPEQPWLMDAAFARLGSFDWVAFTSGHAVEAAVSHPRWRDAWGALGTRPRLAAVGPATAGRLAAHGYAVDLQADESGGAGLAAALVSAHGGALPGVRVLWPCSNMARREFADRVLAAGAILTPVAAYRTVPVAPEGAARFVRDVEARVIDAVAFFSPSAARSLAAVVGGGTLAVLAGRTLVASIGPTTSSALRSLGAPPDLEARPHTASSLAASLVRHLVA